MIRLGRDARGGVSLIFAGFMALGAALAAFAVDLGGLYVEGRRLQGLADAAALAAAVDPGAADSRARAIVTASQWPAARLVRVETGRYIRDRTIDPAARFVAGGTSPDAVRSDVAADVPLRFGAMFGRRAVTLRRTAIAARAPSAAFSVGSRLAALDGGVANAVLSALLGGTVSLSVADYRALADARIDLFRASDTLRTRLSLTGASYAQVLATETTLPVLLGAVADTLDAGGALSAGAAARRLAAAAPARRIAAGRLFDPGPFAPRQSAGRLSAAAPAFDLVQAAIGVAGGARQVSVPLGATVPGLAATTLTIAIGDRPANRPWMTVDADGSRVARTVQTRVHLDTQVGITGLTGILSLRLPLLVDLASAEARLSAIDCATGSVRLAVTPGIGHAAIAAIDTSRLADFSAPLTEGSATLATATLVSIHARLALPLGGGTASTLSFSSADIAAGTTRSVATANLASGLVAGLLARPGLTVSVGPLGLGLNAVTALVASALTAAAPALDLTVNTALGLAGIRLGQADATVGGVRCGHAVLVA